MIFFDTLNRYLHPADPAQQKAIDDSVVIAHMVQMRDACRSHGIALFYPQGRPPGRPRVKVIPELAPAAEDYVIKSTAGTRSTRRICC